MNRKSQEDCNDLEELRRLLVGPELDKLDELNRRLETPENFSSEVGEILPRAMVKSAQQGEKLSEAMLPTVENILRLSIRRDINEITNALFPVIGPAIRMAIKDALSQMLQSLNQTLENSFSLQGLKWRLLSMRTGIPFAQIAMLHSLVYRVEQVFLIHKDTGLLLNHVVQQDIEGHNADLVSSMLSAIENFVGDSFEAEGNRTLDSIEVGELSIWIEQGPDAILAVAIRGEAPNSLRTLLKQALEEIQYEFGLSLAAFDGDTSKFDGTGATLADCMQSQYRSKPGKKSVKGTIVLVLLSILLLYWLGIELYRSAQESEYVVFLKSEPGYVVTDVRHDNGKLVISGLRDALAPEPEQLLSKSSLKIDRVDHRFEPYHSLAPAFIGRRAEKILQPPATVSIRVEGDTLVAEGSVSREWKERLSTRAAKLAGIGSIDDSGLRVLFEPADLDPPDGVSIQLEANVAYIEGRADNAWISSLESRIETIDEIDSVDTRALVNLTEERLVEEIEALEDTIVYFDTATATSFETMEHVDIPALAKNIVNLANKLSRTVLIIVRGFSDSAGNYEHNRLLSLERAQHVAQFLLAAGISSRHLQIRGLEAPVAEENSDDEKHYNRRVEFEVHIE